MYRWLILLGVLGLLVACEQKEEPTPVLEQPTAILEDDSATQEPPQELPGQEMVPGTRATDGLSVLRSTTYTFNNSVGWIVLEVRNDTAEPVANVEITASLLDSSNRERGFAYNISPFANIPPGTVVPVVAEFPAPPDYTTFLALAAVDETPQGSFANLIAEFGLTAQFDPFPTGDFPLVVTGTLSNDRDIELMAPAGVVTVEDSSGNLLGAALMAIEGADAGWQPGMALSFKATFPYLPQPIASASATVAGYYLP